MLISGVRPHCFDFQLCLAGCLMPPADAAMSCPFRLPSSRHTQWATRLAELLGEDMDVPITPVENQSTVATKRDLMVRARQALCSPHLVSHPS
jgi:hypothetical protein